MINFGIIGMGIRGKMYANTLLQNSLAKVVAVSDVSEQNINDAKSMFNVNAYKNVEEMLEKEKLDAVIVATPDTLHKDIVIMAANRVKNLLIEKPLSTSVEECEEMVDVIKKNNVKCMVAFENRWNLPFVSTKQRLETSVCGDILHINCKMNNSIYVPTEMLKWSTNTTPAWFLFPHLVDMSCWLSGKKVKDVYSAGFKKKLVSMGIDTYDSISSIVRFEDDTTAVFSATWVLPNSLPVVADQKFDIFCEEEAITIDMMPQMVSLYSDTFSYPRIIGTPINGRLNAAPNHMLNNFVNDIQEDKPTLCNEDDGRINTLIISAMHKSLESGEKVNVSY